MYELKKERVLGPEERIVASDVNFTRAVLEVTVRLDLGIASL